MIARIPIMDVAPLAEGGSYPVKAAVGEPFTISATVFREGHDRLGAGVVLTGPDGKDRGLTLMHAAGDQPDRYAALVRPDTEGRWTYRVESWSDPYATWHHDAVVKIEAGVDEELMLTEGALLLERAAKALPKKADQARITLTDAVTALADAHRPVAARLAAGVSDEVEEVFTRYPYRELIGESSRYPLLVHRHRSLFGSWYEFFPRSEGAYERSDGTVVSGTLKTAAARLDAVADMGFDVIYLPPIHPIGRVNRKGPNNTLTPGPHDVGSPWAIGAEEGGHDAIHPDLGSFDDFDDFVARARELGLEVALDLALQCAPDHPWVGKHPEWFTTRADGSIAFAENPPKKYQDIYPLNFDNDYDGLFAEIQRVVRLWMNHGVRVFRVDNPHTKPVRFWEHLFAEIAETDPDVIFLAEAFTKPAMMRGLATIGFHQSYTYYTWRNAKWELEEYLSELAHETSHVMRPNLFVNTPDILHAYLQYGGPAAFKVRAAIAACGSPTWGVYAGYELYEHVAVRPGSEEYLDSEKYQLRVRDWDAAERHGATLRPYLTRLNHLRRAHPSLQELRNLTVHGSDDENMLCFSKRAVTPDGQEDIVILVANLDPHATHETTVRLNMPALGLDWHDTFGAHDELTDQTWRWGEANYCRLDPAHEPVHVISVRKTV